MRVRKTSSIVLGLSLLMGIGQASLGESAPISHNCYRPPYHCFFFGTVEQKPSVSNLAPTESPKAIPVLDSKHVSLGSPAGKVVVYTENSKEVEVEMSREVKQRLKEIKATDKARGFIVLQIRKGEKILLKHFITATPHPVITATPHPDHDPDIDPEKALRLWIKEFEEAHPKEKQQN